MSFVFVDVSQTGATISSGGSGDYLKKVIVIPTNEDEGSFTLNDGMTSYTFNHGNASNIAQSTYYRPFEIVFDIESQSGSWTVDTSSNTQLMVFI